MKVKPKIEIVSRNSSKRFPPIYACYCPNCGNRINKNQEEQCQHCKQDIDWSEFD